MKAVYSLVYFSMLLLWQKWYVSAQGQAEEREWYY